MSDPEARQVMYDAVWRPGDDAGWDDVDRMLDALAAAGYTVGRFERVDWTWGDWEDPVLTGPWNDWPDDPGTMPLYRKIEGSTDGADRD